MESGSKTKKEDDKKQVKEENEKKESEYAAKIVEIDTDFKNKKVDRANLSTNFSNCLKNALALWRKKIKNEKIFDDLYVLTAKLIEFALAEKDLANFADSLSKEDKVELVKFYYLTYDRFSKKQNCLTLKPAKIYTLHQNILSKEGVGIVSRALFTIQK